MSRVILSTYSCFSSASLSNSFYTETAWVWGFLHPGCPFGLNTTPWFPSCLSSPDLILDAFDIFIHQSIFFCIYWPWLSVIGIIIGTENRLKNKTDVWLSPFFKRSNFSLPPTIPPRSWIVSSDSLAHYPGPEYKQVSLSRWLWPTQIK